MSVGKPGRSSLDTRFELYRADEPAALYARGAAKIVWIDYAAGKSVPLPDMLRQIIETAAPVAP
jgi:acyl-CoA thioester hydrolase